MLSKLKLFVKTNRKDLITGLTIFLLVLLAFATGFILGAGIFKESCIVIQKAGF